MDPFNLPGAQPEGNPDAGQPKPWERPQQQQPQPQPDNSGNAGNGTLDAVDAGADVVSLGGSAMEAVGDAAGSAIEGAGEIVGEVASGALEGLGGCAEGCGGCSLALLAMLFATAGTAMALFR